MIRKAVVLVTLPLLLASARDDAPRYMLSACRDANLARALGPIANLFDEQRKTRAVLVSIDGCPAVQAYAPGYSDANRFISWSMAKTVTALLVGAMVGDGRLQLDAPAPIAEWHGPGDPRRAITLRHLLTMSSGLAHVEVGKPIEASDTNQTLFVAHPQAMAAAAIAHPLVARPGTTYRYSSLTTIILAEIVARTLTPSRDPKVRAQAYTDFARARLFRPAGIRSAILEYDGAGTQVGGSLMHMTPRDWGRIGALLVDGRGPGGTQVVAPDWLAFIKTPSVANPQYGGQLALNRDRTLLAGKGPPDAVALNGHLGQKIVVARDAAGRGVVIVRLGNTPDDGNAALMTTLGELTASLTH